MTEEKKVKYAIIRDVFVDIAFQSQRMNLR